MRTKKVILNSISLALLQMVMLITGLILPRLYIIVYGSTMNGLVTSTTQFISYFQYVEAGLTYSLMFALYKPLAKKNISDINVIVSTARQSFTKASRIYIALVLIFSTLYPFVLKGNTINFSTKALLFFIIGSLGALDMYTISKYRVLLVADQKEYVITLTSVLAIIVKFILIYLLIMARTNIVIVQASIVISFFIRSLILYCYVKKKYPFVRYDQAPKITLIKQRWDALLLQLSVSLNLSIPIVIVSIVCSLKLASVFSIYNMVFAGLIGILSVFASGVSATFGNIIANGEYDTLRRTKDQFEFIIYYILAIIASCALILVTPFVRIYTNGITDTNYVNNFYTILFVVWVVLHDSRIPHTSLINGAGLYKETRRVNIIQILLLIVLSIVLAYYFSITGVLIAMIIAALYRSVDLILLVQRNIMKQSPISTFLRIIRVFIAIMVAYIPFVTFVRVNATSLFTLFIWMIGVIVWCGFITLILNYIFDRKVFCATLKTLKSLRKDKLRAA